MVAIDLELQASPEFARLRRLPNEIPFAAALSITRTAGKGKQALVAEMQAVFDRPTRYTLRGVFMKPATKRNLQAEVWLKDRRATSKGGYAAEYLLPQILGGSRSLRRFESRLQRMGLLPRGMFVVPAKGAKLDRYGNLNTGQLTAVLTRLGAIEVAQRGPNPRRRRTRYADAQYFVSRGGHLKRGIWQRLSRGRVMPIYIFVDRVTYQKIFNFEKVVNDSVEENLPIEIDRAIDQILQSRR